MILRAALAIALLAPLAAAAVVPPPPAAAAGSVRFLVKGDWGTGTAAQAAVTRRMCAEARRAPVAFVLTTGDNFNAPDGTATAANYWRPERCLRAMRIPWRAAWGNHDLDGTATRDVLGAPRRYAFSHGPLRVIVLDGNVPGDRAQAAFLRRQLRDAPEPVRIIAVHQPLHSSGYHQPSAEARRLWTPLLRSGRVSVVLQGHNHMYERLVVDGVTYITTGGGGATLYPCLRPVPGLRECALAHHFLAVTVTAHAVSVRAVGTRGDTIEKVRIPVPR
jgi:acid phosphatase